MFLQMKGCRMEVDSPQATSCKAWTRTRNGQPEQKLNSTSAVDGPHICFVRGKNRRASNNRRQRLFGNRTQECFIIA